MMRKCEKCLVGADPLQNMSGFDSTFLLVWKIFDVHLRSVFLSLKFLGLMMRKCEKCLGLDIKSRLRFIPAGQSGAKQGKEADQSSIFRILTLKLQFELLGHP